MCGQCCREPWTIPVDKETADSLENLSKQEPLATFLEGKSPTTVTQSGTLGYTCEDGLCVFLESDGMCYLHRQFGPLGKGYVCREFPILLTETPEGIYHGYSFVCAAVREPALEETSQDDTGFSVDAILESRDHHYRTVPEKISFRRTGPLALNWNEYKLIEQGLLAILSMWERPLSECLLGGYTYLVLLERFLLQTSMPSGSPFGKTQVLEHFLDKMGKTDFDMVFTLSKKQRPSGLVRRFVNAFGISLLRQLSSKGKGGGRFQLIASVAGELVRRKKPIPHLLERALDSQLRRYFIHLIWRKDLVSDKGPFGGQSLLLSFGGMLMLYSLIVQRSRELAEMRSPEDAVSAAIHQVERDLVAHFHLRGDPDKPGLKFFIGWWETLVQRKVYAASVTALDLEK